MSTTMTTMTTATDPHSFAKLDQGMVRHLELDLAVDFGRRQLRGTATLFVKRADGTEGARGGRLDLDTRDLTIEGIEDLGGVPLKWDLHAADPVLGARLSVRVPEGTPGLRIHYATSPEASALQWLGPEHTAGGEQPFLFSQCQAIHARSMVPLQDSPRVRFTYDASLTIPRDLMAVMSSAPGEVRPARAPDMRRLRFHMGQPIPSYLLALAVGDLSSKELGPRSVIWAEPATLEAAASEFSGMDAMLLAAEELFGPYRWDRFDALVMPPAFPYGGMENPRMTFLTPTLLAGDKSLVNVLTHELAHSWSGNLVTNATLDDFWLNEGFTVWAERRILEQLEGEGAVTLHAAIGRAGLDEAIERFGADSPNTRLKTDTAGQDPDAVYSLVPYEKGYLFVRLLEETVGREAFDAFVRQYIERFAFCSISTEDFEAFLAEALPGVAERVSAEAWLRGEGVPANAPRSESAHLKKLQSLARGITKGKRPTLKVAAAWSVTDWQVYLQALPAELPQEDCQWLDESFELTASRNAEILAAWLRIAARSGYEASYPRLRSFLGEVGRMKYLKPLYGALHASEATMYMARDIFDENAAHYHPVARAGLQAMLRG